MLPPVESAKVNREKKEVNMNVFFKFTILQESLLDRMDTGLSG